MVSKQSFRRYKSGQERQGAGDKQATKSVNKINQLVIVAYKGNNMGDLTQPLWDSWGVAEAAGQRRPLGGGELRPPWEEGPSASQTSGRGAEKYPERGNIKRKIPEARIILAYSREKTQGEQEKRQAGARSRGARSSMAKWNGAPEPDSAQGTGVAWFTGKIPPGYWWMWLERDTGATWRGAGQLLLQPKWEMCGWTRWEWWRGKMGWSRVCFPDGENRTDPTG